MNSIIAAILLLFALAVPAFAQQGVPIGEPKGQWFTSAGAVCNGCLMNAYIAGTTTRLDTYTTAALTVANANPVVLDSAGRAAIFVGDRAYKFVLTTAAGVEIWTADNVLGRAPPANVLAKTAAYTVLASDGKDVLINGDASGGAFTVTLFTAVGNAGRVVRVVKADSSANAITLDGAGAETINGASSVTLGTQYDSVSVMSTGTAWLTISADADTSTRAGQCDCRLTLTSLVPVTTTDVTAAGTLYLTPYNGNKLSTYNGTSWDIAAFTQTSTALTLTTDTNYDVFVYRSGGFPFLELTAWTNDTTRATALVLQDGAWVKSGTTTRMYVGTIRASGSNVTEDSAAKRFVWNRFNRVPRPMRVLEATNTWTYSTSTWRQANGATGNQLDVVVGLADDPIEVWAFGIATHSSTGQASVAIGEDGVTPHASSLKIPSVGSTAVYGTPVSHLTIVPAIGRHYYTWLEYATGGATMTWQGDNGGTDVQSGIAGTWRN